LINASVHLKINIAGFLAKHITRYAGNGYLTDQLGSFQDDAKPGLFLKNVAFFLTIRGETIL
jgi:hypothetical protein